MNIISVKLARAVWLFPHGDINPHGKYILPVLSDLIARYKFALVPDYAEAIKTSQGIKYTQGVFPHNRFGDIAFDLTIYNDGFVCDTATDTEASEAVLEEIIGWATEFHGLHKPTSIRKQYVSEIYVETSKSLGSINRKLEKIAKLISENVAGFGNVSYQVGALSFAAEQAGALTPPLFRFERAENIPYSQNRFYSIAPLKTNNHIEVLNEIESILTG